jgi:serine/threonine protein phosphatase 1
MTIAAVGSHTDSPDTVTLADLPVTASQPGSTPQVMARNEADASFGGPWVTRHGALIEYGQQYENFLDELVRQRLLAQPGSEATLAQWLRVIGGNSSAIRDKLWSSDAFLDLPERARLWIMQRDEAPSDRYYWGMRQLMVEYAQWGRSDPARFSSYVNDLANGKQEAWGPFRERVKQQLQVDSQQAFAEAFSPFQFARAWSGPGEFNAAAFGLGFTDSIIINAASGVADVAAIGANPLEAGQRFASFIGNLPQHAQDAWNGAMRTAQEIVRQIPNATSYDYGYATGQVAQLAMAGYEAAQVARALTNLAKRRFSSSEEFGIALRRELNGGSTTAGLRSVPGANAAERAQTITNWLERDVGRFQRGEISSSQLSETLATGNALLKAERQGWDAATVRRYADLSVRAQEAQRVALNGRPAGADAPHGNTPVLTQAQLVQARDQALYSRLGEIPENVRGLYAQALFDRAAASGQTGSLNALQGFVNDITPQSQVWRAIENDVRQHIAYSRLGEIPENVRGLYAQALLSKAASSGRAGSSADLLKFVNDVTPRSQVWRGIEADVQQRILYSRLDGIPEGSRSRYAQAILDKAIRSGRAGSSAELARFVTDITPDSQVWRAIQTAAQTSRPSTATPNLPTSTPTPTPTTTSTPPAAETAPQTPAQSPELQAASPNQLWSERWQAYQQNNPRYASQIQAKSQQFGFSIEDVFKAADRHGLDPLSAATLLQARKQQPVQIDSGRLPQEAANQDQARALYQDLSTVPTGGLPPPTAANGPGTRFSSEYDAAMASLSHERSLTSQDPYFGEYSAYVYRRGDGSFGYTPMLRQPPGGGTMPLSQDVPAGGTIVAVTHSHPANFIDQFSWGDITTARRLAQEVPSTYVVHQNGAVDLYDPSANRVIRYGNGNGGTELQGAAPNTGPTPPEEKTLTIPGEFWADAALDRSALSQRYGLNDTQLDALEAMRPMRVQLRTLTETRFDSKEQAAAGAYGLVEKLYERTPALRESLELGGQIYRDGEGRWRVSLPLVGPSGSSVGTGSTPNAQSPVATDSVFWHTHPSSLPHSSHASGFSFADLTAALKSGRDMFVYQNGRAYLMEVGDAWNTLPAAQRQALVSRLQADADIVRSSAVSQADRDAALVRLRDTVQQTPVSVTLFERSGVNPSAGEPVNIFPISLWTEGGAVELLPNRSPPRRLPSVPEPTTQGSAPQSPLLITQPDVSFELRPQSTDGRTLIVLPDTHGRDDLQQRAFDYLRNQQDWVFGDNTTVVSLGDTIDKGPNSAQNVEALINRDQEPGVSEVITHIGNHELWLTEWLKNPDKLKYAHDWIANRGGRIALESYDRFAKEHPELSSFSLDGIDLQNMPLREVTDANGRTTSVPDNSDGFYTRLYDRIIEGLPQRHLDFFANLQPSTRIGDYFFSHAGADPSRTLDNQGLGALTWIRDPYLRFDGQWIGDPNTIAVSGHTVLRQPLIQENKFALDLGTFMTGDFMAAILQNDLVRFAIFRNDAEPVWTDIRGGFDQNLFAPQFDPSQVIANPKKR